MSDKNIDDGIGREELLKQLQSIESGTAKKGIVQQTDCINFRRGRAQTHNGEVTASARVAIDEEGCVKAKLLLGILDKLPDKKIQVRFTDEKLIITGRHALHIEIPTETSEPFIFPKKDRPKEWKVLHPDFCKAIRLAQYCAGNDEKTQYLSTFIKVAPDMVASLDNVTQSLVWKFKDNDSGVSVPALYKADAIKNILDIEPSEICETPSWIHFRNGRDVMFSCLQHEGVENFPDLDTLADFKGHKARLPKSLAVVAACAGEFTKDNKDENFVQVEIIPGSGGIGKIRVRGESDTGKFKRLIPNVKYKGPAIIFSLSSKLLEEIVQSYTRCRLSDERMCIQEGSFSYTVCLQQSREDSKKQKDNGED